MTYYEKCCSIRLNDLVKYVSLVFPGQTITGDYVFRNAPLKNIAKSSAATQRIIDWSKKELEKKEIKNEV